MDFLALAQQCAPLVDTDTMRRIVHVESFYNPYAIGVVGGRLERQPRNKNEAIATMTWLEHNGFNYSVGLAQVNKHNFARYGLTGATAFDPCRNLNAGASILQACYTRARQHGRDEQAALRDAFSCYYSGNFLTGYSHGYVTKIVTANVDPALPPVAGSNTYRPAPRTNKTIALAHKTNDSRSSSGHVDPTAPDDASAVQSALLF